MVISLRSPAVVGAKKGISWGDMFRTNSAIFWKCYQTQIQRRTWIKNYQERFALQNFNVDHWTIFKPTISALFQVTLHSVQSCCAECTFKQQMCHDLCVNFTLYTTQCIRHVCAVNSSTASSSPQLFPPQRRCSTSSGHRMEEGEEGKRQIQIQTWTQIQIQM